MMVHQFVNDAYVLGSEESRRLGWDFVGSEQLLMGLVAEKQGTAGEILRHFMTLKDLRIEVERYIGRCNSFAFDPLPMNNEASSIMSTAENLANGELVETHHVLQAMLEFPKFISYRMLDYFGVDKDSIKQYM